MYGGWLIRLLCEKWDHKVCQAVVAREVVDELDDAWCSRISHAPGIVVADAHHSSAVEGQADGTWLSAGGGGKYQTICKMKVLICRLDDAAKLANCIF